jgi:hypothetical protein
MSDNELPDDIARRVEIIDADREEAEGWALFCLCEGDCPEFVGFFAAEEAAITHGDSRDENNERRYTDPGVVPALLTPHGIVCSNDFNIDDHSKLRALLAGRGARP